MTTPRPDTPDLSTVDAEYARLATIGPALAVLTDCTYDEAIAYRWRPYAARHSLPTDFASADSRALTLEEVERVIAAAATGELRRGTRDGAQDRSGQPLAVDTVRGLLAALRHAHLTHGLGWLDDSGQGRLRELMRGYENTYSQPKVPALIMEPGHLQALFGSVPWTDPSAVIMACALRAVSADTGIAMADLFDARLVPSRTDEEAVRLAGSFGTIAVECIAIPTEPATSAACPHCLLMHSGVVSDPGPLVPKRIAGAGPDRRAFVIRCAKAAAALVPGAQLDRSTLTMSASATLAQRLALLAPPAALAWLTARALCLAQMAVGLRDDDVARLASPQTRIGQATLTLAIRGKYSNGDSSIFTLSATGGPLCPVNAVWLYDQYVRVFLPSRGSLFVPMDGKVVKHPVEKAYDPASRAPYQWYRKWLEAADKQLGLSTPAPAGGRTHLTPHSSRRGFTTAAHAQGKSIEEIQKALRHARPDTTARYLGAPAEPISDLLDDIADEPNP